MASPSHPLTRREDRTTSHSTTDAEIPNSSHEERHVEPTGPNSPTDSPTNSGRSPTALVQTPATDVSTEDGKLQSIINTAPRSSLDSGKNGKPQSRPWRPSILRLGPLAGLIALLFSFLQIFASYAILAASHNDLVANWKYQPSVYLAVLTAISKVS
jgi:hypothetical protein